MVPTPKTQDRKRKSSGNNDDTDSPAKKRIGKTKETVINLDVEDPFNFEKKKDSHPEPLKNINIERTAFGGVKFSKSPTSLERYINVEKIAERRGNVSGTVSSSNSNTPCPGSLPSLKSSLKLKATPGSPVSSRTPKFVKEKKAPIRTNVSTPKTKKEETEKPIESKFNESASKRRSRASEFDVSMTPKEKKLTLDDYCIVPELTAEQQLEVDHSKEHKLLEAGARVLALWGQDYYAANICGRDGLSRYYVHFVEDNLNRLLPPNGVVSLSSLAAGHKVSFIFLQDDQFIGKSGEIVNTPSFDTPTEWANGIFKIKTEEDDEILSVVWEKIFLTKEEYKVISASSVNVTIDVEEENIVNESRSSRRSRSTRYSEANINANQLSAVRTKTPRTPKKIILVEENKEDDEKVLEIKNSSEKEETIDKAIEEKELDDNGAEKVETKEDVEKEETIDDSILKSTSRRSLRRSTIISQATKTLKSSTKTPLRSRANRSAAANETIKKDVNISKDEIKCFGDATASETLKDENTDNKTNEVSFNQFLSSNTISYSNKTEKSEVSDDINDQSLIMEVDEQEAIEENKTDDKKDENDINGSETVVEIEQSNETQDKGNHEKLNQPNKTLNASSSVKETLTKNEKNKTNNKEELTSNNNNNKNVSLSLKESGSSVQSVSIASFSSPKTEEEASIFKNMKFVLTSATRSKKNTDFQKRDYRIKIEERGGEIIDDFSLLKENDNAFLIADTYYRTHKYLSALSISVPCVKHDWILACVKEKRLLDHIQYMLPAGESSLDQNQICEWKPLKNILLKDKKIWVYSSVYIKPEERAISFVDIWSSIIKNLGAELIEKKFSTLKEKIDFCIKTPIDILLTDLSCEKELAEQVEAKGGIVVSSEWVIQAIVTGDLPDVTSSDRFRFDSSI